MATKISADAVRAIQSSPSPRKAKKPALKPLPTRQELREESRGRDRSQGNAPCLPWAVRRSIVSQLRVVPPHSLHHWQVDIARRLARIDQEVWLLPIDWRRYASDLDHLAHVQTAERSKAEEGRNHAAIAAALKKASAYLRRDGQVDPLVYGAVEFLARHKPDRFAQFYAPRLLDEDEPRLSELLSALAWFIEGKDIQVHGLHRIDWPEFGQALPRTAGRKGAAIEAAARVRSFFERHTGKPHDNLVDKVVDAYFPEFTGATKSDSAYRRSLRAKRTKAKK